MSRLIPTVAVVVGAALVVAGVALWSIPAALVVAGLPLVAVGVLYRYEEN